MQPEPIQLKDVHLSRQGRSILSGLTLDLRARRIGILGRNGSGKTSLLRLIAGLERPSQGQLRIGDLDPERDRKALLSAIGILFQNPDHQILFPTVIEELAFGLQQMGQSRQEAEARAARMLAEQGRSHWRDAHCHHLSQGQRQHLCLMAILLMQPRTLLLDEPYSGLDLPTAARLQRRLDRLDQRLILISHDPARMAGMDWLVWIDAGRLVAEGPAAEILPRFAARMAELGEDDADADLA